MNIPKLNEIAGSNWRFLTKNSYPGRGLVIGTDETGKYLVQIYFLESRSEKNRNRVLTAESGNGRIFTEPADPSKLTDEERAEIKNGRSLIIYNAMMEANNSHVVSNGRHTDHVARGLKNYEPLCETLADWKYEQDPPVWTPRITAVCSTSGLRPHFEISILRQSLMTGFENEESWVDCERFYYQWDSIHPGFGFGVTTYLIDGNPPPVFRGEPMLLPIRGDINAIADSYWSALNLSNRISLVVKFIRLDNGQSLPPVIINKYEKVAEPAES